MTEEVIVVAKWDYTAQQEQELDIRKNERLFLLDDSKTWWLVRNTGNHTGYVPSNYVERKNSLKKGSLVKNIKDTLVTGNMRASYASVLLCSLLLCLPPPSGAAESEREKRSLPYWGLWSSDFFGWLEELRAQAAESGMQDLARTFWAHFPISRELGYESPEADPPPEE
ncbi:cytoplasmic protein NCK2a isoform X2 [Leuresthes tenuis]|uniref:cytoplasmic protein NCK2a isoform X2 n=1 Tax=Leuresthes tenuis TaxID=355514 RepID=UPI003B50E631